MTTKAASPLSLPGGPQAAQHPGCCIKSWHQVLLSSKTGRQTSQNTSGTDPYEHSQEWLPTPRAEFNFQNILSSFLSAKWLYTTSAFHSVYSLVPLYWIDSLAEPQLGTETISLAAQDPFSKTHQDLRSASCINPHLTICMLLILQKSVVLGTCLTLGACLTNWPKQDL